MYFLDDDARNHIKVMLLNGEMPESETERIALAESVFNSLVEDKDAVKLYERKSKARGYLISVWKTNDKYYLIDSIRNEFKTYNNTIYVSNSENDTINIAKFIYKNIGTIMRDYRQQILDAEKMHVDTGA